MTSTDWSWRLALANAALVGASACGLALGDLLAAPVWSLWLLAIGAIALTAVFNWCCGRWMLSPLEQLAQETRQFFAGDGDSFPAVTVGDDLSVVSAALDRLREKLASRVDQVQENAERLKIVLGSMVEGVLAVGVDQTILLANDAGRQLLDFSTSQPIGRPLLEVTRARAVHEAVARTIESQSPVELEFEAPGKLRRALSMRTTRLPGKPSPGVMVVLHDVTELRRLENLRRELVANVSHELKTPLAAIKAYAETLRMGAVNDPEHNLNFILRIEEQAERLHQLIIDMLQIARVESGQEVFDIVAVDLRDMLEQCQAQFEDLAAAKQIQMVIPLPPATLTVRADEEGVRTILNNLVDNAIKYTSRAGRVCIRCVENGEYVALEVEDTGIGIAEKDQARIFERFYRVDKARSRELGGTGLGLSIVKHLSQAFGGSVSLQSQPGQGSTFRVTLPKG